jgi:hypothetical protein
VLVQWLQLYEINTELVASVLKALSPHVSEYVIYAPTDINILIVAKKGGTLVDPDPSIFQMPALAAELKRIGIFNVRDLKLHRIGGKKALDPFFSSFSIPPNSDFVPVLDLNAARTRFLGSNAKEFIDLSKMPLPLEMLEEGSHPSLGVQFGENPFFSKTRSAQAAFAIFGFLQGKNVQNSMRFIPPSLKMDLERVNQFFSECENSELKGIPGSLFRINVATVPYFSPEDFDQVWEKFNVDLCGANWTQQEKDWAGLLQAVGRRDAHVMGRLSLELLEGKAYSAELPAEYLLGVAILGNIANKDFSNLRQIWNQNETVISKARSENLGWRLLATQMEGLLSSH